MATKEEKLLELEAELEEASKVLAKAEEEVDIALCDIDRLDHQIYNLRGDDDSV